VASFQELVGLMEHMRGPDGCAWDRKQTLADFKTHFGNESREVLDALENDDMENLKEELGDVLWHVLFMSQIAKEGGAFTIDDVLEGVKDKIVRRHPHVFGGRRIDDPDEIVAEWKRIKKREKAARK